MAMNVTNLRSFHAVAKHGGFSRAATLMNLSQPTLTRQVRDLETAYGMQLFDRSTRHVALTEQGAKLFELSGRVFEDLEAVERFLRAGSKTDWTVYSVRNQMLASFIQFTYARPNVRYVNVKMMPSGLVYDGLLARSCDFGMLTMPRPNEAIESIEIGDFPVLAYVGDDHPWQQRGQISVRDLDGHRIVIASAAAQTRRTFDREIAKAGVKVDIVQEVDDFEVIIMLAKAGIGVGIIGATGESSLSEAQAVRFEEAEMSQPLHFAVAAAEHRSPATDALFRLARRMLLSA